MLTRGLELLAKGTFVPRRLLYTGPANTYRLDHQRIERTPRLPGPGVRQGRDGRWHAIVAGEQCTAEGAGWTEAEAVAVATMRADSRAFAIQVRRPQSPSG